MHGAVQSGSMRSPKPLSGAVPTQQLKSGVESGQNPSSIPSHSKGKKRDRSDQGMDSGKRERDRSDKLEGASSFNLKLYSLKAEIGSMTDRGGLANIDAVDKLVNIMYRDKVDWKIDLAGRGMLVDIIAATEKNDCLSRFVQLRGLHVLDDWLQDLYKGKAGDESSPKENDKAVDDLLLALLRALSKLPINLDALKVSHIGKSVNNLRGHKNCEIQKKARGLIDTWKKRVEAEMNDPKYIGTSQAVSWSGRPGFSEVAPSGNRTAGLSEPSSKSTISHLPSLKSLITKSEQLESVGNSYSGASALSKLQLSQASTVPSSSKDCLSKLDGGSGNSEMHHATVKEERSSSSSQSHNNGQSYSSDHVKAHVSSKEEARSSASMAAVRCSGSSRHRRVNNGHLGSGAHMESASSGKSGPLDHTSVLDKMSFPAMACEKSADAPLSDLGGNHRLIVRFPNPGRSPAGSASGGSIEDPSTVISSRSSPVLADKPDTDNSCKHKGSAANCRPQSLSDAGMESWQSNHVKGQLCYDECEKAPFNLHDNESNRTSDENEKKCVSGGKPELGVLHSECAAAADEVEKTACASGVDCSSENDKGFKDEARTNAFSSINALIESCVQYSEGGTFSHIRDNTGMNLLASVATGEISKSALNSPSGSPMTSSAAAENFVSEHVGKSRSSPEEIQNVVPENNNGDDSLALKREDPHHRIIQGNKDLRNMEPSVASKMDENGNIDVAVHHEVENECNDKVKAFRQGDGGSDSLSAKGCSSANEDSKHTSMTGKVEGGVPHSSEICDSSSARQSKASLVETGKLMIEKTESSLVDAEVQSAVFGSEQQMDHNSKSLSPEHAVKPSTVFDKFVPNNEFSNGAAIKDRPTDTGHARALIGAVHGNVRDEKINVDKEENNSLNNPDEDLGQRDISRSEAVISSRVKGSPISGARLDFDLNEGIPGEDGQMSEFASSAMVLSSASAFFPTLPSSSSHLSSGLAAPITVAAAAKGPFVPPENLLRIKSEAGWRGSAATSAFRPAEPRKVVQPSASEVASSSAAAGRQSRPLLDFDLNVADGDETGPDEVVAYRDASNYDSLTRTAPAGLELDLNRVEESAESAPPPFNVGHRFEMPLLPARQLPEGTSGVEANSSRGFDLNNGPGVDEAGGEPAFRNQFPKNANYIPFLPPMAGMRMNNAEMGTMSSWFPTGNLYPAVAVQPFLPDRGEPPYSILAAPGTQGILLPAAGGVPFGSENYRGPTLPSSSAMPFTPAAYPCATFPFGSSFPHPSPVFSVGSMHYVDPGGSRTPCYPSIPPLFVGPAGPSSASVQRPYIINAADSMNATSMHDMSRMWSRQDLDLNFGPRSADADGKERLPSGSRQSIIPLSSALVDEQLMIHQGPGIGLKRKEPEGGWDPERSSYRQVSGSEGTVANNREQISADSSSWHTPPPKFE